MHVPDEVPPGPQGALVPEDCHRRWSNGYNRESAPIPAGDGAAEFSCQTISSPRPSWEEILRSGFEASMLLRCNITESSQLEHVRNETLSLLYVIPALHKAAAQTHSNVTAAEQADAAISLNLTRLRQHLRIKIADTEDLNCAQKALHDIASFFDDLAALAESEDSSTYDVFRRIID